MEGIEGGGSDNDGSYHSSYVSTDDELDFESSASRLQCSDRLISIVKSVCRGSPEENKGYILFAQHIFRKCTEKDKVFTEEEEEKIGEVFKKLKTSMPSLYFKESTIQKFIDLNIKISWELSELHEEDSDLRKAPSLYTKRMSHFSEEDKLKILKRWTQFCKKYNFDPKIPHVFGPNPLIKFRHRGHKLINFVRFIGRDFPDRPLSSIYNQFNMLTSSKKKGRFSEKEDEVLRQIFEVSELLGLNSFYLRFGNLILGRSKQSIYKRYKRLYPFTNFREHNEPGKRKKITSNGMAEGSKSEGRKKGNLRGSSKTKFISKWLMMVKPLEEDGFNKYELMKDLIIRLNSDSYSDWEDIKWKELGKELKLGCILLFFTLNKFVKQFVPAEIQKDFKACINFLSTNCLPKLIKKIDEMNET